VFANPVADSSGRVVGKLSAACVTATGAKVFTNSELTCTGVLTLPGGTLTVAANTSPGKSTTIGAITGGTGRYAYAAGVYRAKEGNGSSRTTITLAG
jgi:hypothetical protein